MSLFAMHEIVDGNGVALAADADPNSTAPPDHRIVELPNVPPHAANGFLVCALDGTTITAQPYLLEPASGVWVPLYAAAAATPSAPRVFHTAGLGLARGASVFVRLTANTAVTKVGWRYG
jgi:hypothetical protein